MKARIHTNRHKVHCITNEHQGIPIAAAGRLNAESSDGVRVQRMNTKGLFQDAIILDRPAYPSITMSGRYHLPSHHDRVYYSANYHSTPSAPYSCGHYYHPPNSCHRRSSHRAQPSHHYNYNPVVQEWNYPPNYPYYHEQVQHPSRYSYYR